MVIRKDRRTPKLIVPDIMGFPVVTRYKYLGVLVDDSLKLDLEVARKKELQTKLEKFNRIVRGEYLSDY